MRKLAVAGVAGVLLVAGAATALASGTPRITVKPTVTPNRVGTPAHPQGVHLDVKIIWQQLGPADQPVTQKFKVLFPKGSLYNGARYPSCTYAKLNAAGANACPSAIMGRGTGGAYADTVFTHPQITVVNGGRNTVYFYTVLNNPARVQSPVVGHIKRIGGKYAYELDVSVPRILQVVAGVPIELYFLDVHAGNGSWLATTGCPGGHWPFSVTSYYDNHTSATYTASVRCRR